MQHDLRRHHGLNRAKLGFMMIFGLFGKKNGNRRIVEKQYASLTKAARHPYLYEVLNVPDTVMGRFEMLSAILILYFRRTRASGTSGQEIAQEIVDDLEAALEQFRLIAGDLAGAGAEAD